MPTLFCTTTFKAAEENFSISLVARHRLQLGSSDECLRTNERLPDFDTLPLSDLVFSLSGVHQKHKITGAKMQVSYPVRHLSEVLKNNSRQLGLSTVSDVFMDSDGLAKISLSPLRAYTPESRSPKLYLNSIDLVYHFRSESGHDNGIFDIFSEQQYLPYMSTLDRIVEKFLAMLLRRYPLIFGPYIQKLEAESALCKPLCHALRSIYERSSSLSFQKRFTETLSDLKEQSIALENEAYKTVENNFQLDPSSLYDGNCLNEVDLLRLSFSRLVRCRIRPPLLKALERSKLVDKTVATFRIALEENPSLSQDVDTLLPLSPRQADLSLLCNEVAPQYDQDGSALPSWRPDQSKVLDDNDTSEMLNDPHFDTFLLTHQESVQRSDEAGDETLRQYISVTPRYASPSSSQTESILTPSASQGSILPSLNLAPPALLSEEDVASESWPSPPACLDYLPYDIGGSCCSEMEDFEHRDWFKDGSFISHDLSAQETGDFSCACDIQDIRLDSSIPGSMREPGDLVELDWSEDGSAHDTALRQDLCSPLFLYPDSPIFIALDDLIDHSAPVNSNQAMDDLDLSEL